MVLESQPDLTVVDEAAGGATAIARTAELEPDVVLMDVRIPEVDKTPPVRSCSTPALPGADPHYL